MLTHGITEAIVQLGTTVPGTLPVCRPLVTAPGNLRKGFSPESDQASTHNNPQEYSGGPWRVKTTSGGGPQHDRRGRCRADAGQRRTGILVIVDDLSAMNPTMDTCNVKGKGKPVAGWKDKA